MTSIGEAADSETFVGGEGGEAEEAALDKAVGVEDEGVEGRLLAGEGKPVVVVLEILHAPSGARRGG